MPGGTAARSAPKESLREANAVEEGTGTVIRPRAEELRWADIAWRTDLWDGSREAAALGRPIFLWAMNGNPLGCV